MAVETHGVTHSDALDELDVDQSLISSSSDRLSTTQIDRWIDRGAGQLNAILRARSIDPSSVADDERELIRSGVIAYAAAKSYRALGRSDSADPHWEEWSSVRKTLRERDRDLGDEIDKGHEVRAPNVDTSSTKSSPQWGTDYEP